MIDKGYTKAAFRKIKKIMPAEFSLMSVGANTGMFARAVRYGILEKVGTGRYRVMPGIKDPWKSYTKRTDQIRHEGKRPRGLRSLSANKNLPIVQGDHAIPAGPKISIAAYIGGQKLIVVGKQIFLGIEVALVPKGGD